MIRHCAGLPTRSTGPRGPPTGRSRPGPQRETGSAPPPGSSPWQAAARPTPRRPRFTWRRASSGWPGRSASCARRSSRRRRRPRRGRRPKACTPPSAGRGRAPRRWPSPPRRGRTRPSASPETQHGLIFRSRSSLGHSRLKAAVTSPRSHLRGQDLRRTLPRVRVLAGEPSQSSRDPPQRERASRSTRSRIRSSGHGGRHLGHDAKLILHAQGEPGHVEVASPRHRSEDPDVAHAEALAEPFDRILVRAYLAHRDGTTRSLNLHLRPGARPLRGSGRARQRLISRGGRMSDPLAGE